MTAPNSSGNDIHCILACLSLASERAQALAREAARLARLFQAELHFVHAGEDTPERRAFLSDLLQYALHAEGISGNGASLHSAAPLLPNLLIEPGRPDKVIAAMARRIGADMIVAGALEREGLIEAFAGSVARRIARNAPCSVLLITEPRPEGNRLHSIVAAVSMDSASAAMLRFVSNLARRERTEIVHIVSEYELLGARDSMGGIASEDALDHAEQCETAEMLDLKDFVAGFDTSGLKIELACLKGREGSGAVEHARITGADLLVLPAPGRRLTFWDRFFVHPTEFVLQSLPCALLLYRRRGAGAKSTVTPAG